MKSMLVSSFRKYSISFSKRFFSPQTWGGSRGLRGHPGGWHGRRHLPVTPSQPCQVLPSVWPSGTWPWGHALAWGHQAQWLEHPQLSHGMGIFRMEDAPMMQGSATRGENEARIHLDDGYQRGDRASLLGTHLLEVVKGGQDDVVATSDQADGGQQLQHQRLGPVETQGARGSGLWGGRGDRGMGDRGWVLPGVLVVEAQGDLVDAGWVVHHQAEARLGGKKSINGVVSPPVLTPGMLWDLGTSPCHIPTRREVE